MRVADTPFVPLLPLLRWSLAVMMALAASGQDGGLTVDANSSRRRINRSEISAESPKVSSSVPVATCHGSQLRRSMATVPVMFLGAADDSGCLTRNQLTASLASLVHGQAPPTRHARDSGIISRFSSPSPVHDCFRWLQQKRRAPSHLVHNCVDRQFNHILACGFGHLRPERSMSIFGA